MRYALTVCPAQRLFGKGKREPCEFCSSRHKRQQVGPFSEPITRKGRRVGGFGFVTFTKMGGFSRRTILEVHKALGDNRCLEQIRKAEQPNHGRIVAHDLSPKASAMNQCPWKSISSFDWARNRYRMVPPKWSSVALQVV